MTTNLVGQTLGEFRVQAEIGRGGMGSVYLAFDQSLQRWVALKVLPPMLTGKAEFIERFTREARAAAQLRHPNIVTIYNVGQKGDINYFTMEYVEGESLKQLLERQGPMPPAEMLAIMRQLAAALDYAHQRGMIHRDIKPANVMLEPGGRVVLTDFGLVRATSDSHLTTAGSSLGTPEYMAPEQVTGQETDYRTDLYALGIVAYELLSGTTPFRGESSLIVMHRHVYDPPPPIERFRPDLPPQVGQVLQFALAKDPAHRYGSGQELVGALEAALSGQRAAAPAGLPLAHTAQVPSPPAPPATDRRGGARWPLLIGGGVLLMLAVLVPAVWLAARAVLAGRGGSLTPTRPPATSTRPVTVAETAAPTSLAEMTPTTQPALTAETRTPTARPTRVPTVVPTGEPTEGPAEVSTDVPTVLPTTVPTLSASATPTPTPVPGTGALIDFENFGTWRRGDQANGTFTQSSEQAKGGQFSGKLAYSFPSGENDFVVFTRRVNIGGTPNAISAWVYGDGSGHYINVWIVDADGEVWQSTFGQVSHSGWRQMTAAIRTGQPWPWDHISGPDNGTLDYPIAFYGLALDDVPDSYSGSGTIYIDEITAWTSSGGSAPTPGSAAGPTTAPTAASGTAGAIIYTVQRDGGYYLASTSPGSAQGQEIGPTDAANSSCSGATASTSDGTSFSLYLGRRCGISHPAACRSPDGQWEIVSFLGSNGWILSVRRVADNQTVHGIYEGGSLNTDEGIVWSPDSSRFLFTLGHALHTASPFNPGYSQIVADAYQAYFSPDGTRLLYLCPSGGTFDVCSSGADGSGQSNLTNAPGVTKQCARWRN